MSDLSTELGKITNSILSDYVKKVVDTQVANLHPVTVSIKGLSKLTGMSESWLRQHAVDTPEFINIEFDLGSKRLWQADKVNDAWLTYINQHGTPASTRLPQSVIREQKRGLLI
ncbi:hypothetical protein [Lentilactobacillus kosonis]|uniref:Uncharacterized protein n=1 Tax=Lentilactobacillus kosonis TaxID=2810561 RepID=A0A401FPC0_9LACO|nr:hypothetical protein [Lentilactobacillus kosonis]GAY74235.1 hypothetical protein NBRC111893_2381 [Lentilactobacillus kosonis]